MHILENDVHRNVKVEKVSNVSKDNITGNRDYVYPSNEMWILNMRTKPGFSEEIRFVFIVVLFKAFVQKTFLTS